MAIVTLTEAAALAGVSRGTLYNRLKDGTLSRSEGGVDISELLRVFGPLGASAGQVDVSADVSDAPVDVQSGPLTEVDAQLAEVLERRLARADEDTSWLREVLAQRELVIAEKERQLAEAQTRLDEREAFWTRQMTQMQALLPAPAAAAPPRGFWRRLLGA